MEDRISLLLSTKGLVEDPVNHGLKSSIFCLFDGGGDCGRSLAGHGGNDCVDFISNRFISTLVALEASNDA